MAIVLMERGLGFELFSDEELKGIDDVKICGDHVEVICGCTSNFFGDAMGILKIFANGDLFITCTCAHNCNEGDFTPISFERHSEKELPRNWKKNIWVFIDDEKVPISETPLLNYYLLFHKRVMQPRKSKVEHFHRDEFLSCTKCNKLRRFQVHVEDNCRAYHIAVRDPNWECSFHPDKKNCDEEEERAGRRAHRGCAREKNCKGCPSCVCTGCWACRFSNCNCQPCIDFTKNARPPKLGKPTEA